MTAVLIAIIVAGWLTHHLLLAVPADVVLWCVWVYVNPMTNCGWCHGSGKHKLSSRKTFGNCWNPRCQRGTVMRFGSRTVTRAVMALGVYKNRSK